jgi:3-hydroxyacyl-[acyl-carrier-protein] dehydratase
MRVSKDQIESYIPQRAPFVMIDNLVEATKEKFVTDFFILPDNIFVEAGVLREFGLIENIAQSCAAGLAVLNNSTRDAPVDGFIGGISKLIVYSLPGISDTVRTYITPIAQLGEMYLLKAETLVNEKKLLECEIKLAGSTKNTQRT